MMKEFPFVEKSTEEMINEANTVLKNIENEKDKSPEEVTEDEAEFGYFQSDEDDWREKAYDT